MQKRTHARRRHCRNQSPQRRMLEKIATAKNSHHKEQAQRTVTVTRIMAKIATLQGSRFAKVHNCSFQVSKVPKLQGSRVPEWVPRLQCHGAGFQGSDLQGSNVFHTCKRPVDARLQGFRIPGLQGVKLSNFKIPGSQNSTITCFQESKVAFWHFSWNYLTPRPSAWNPTKPLLDAVGMWSTPPSSRCGNVVDHLNDFNFQCHIHTAHCLILYPRNAQDLSRSRRAEDQSDDFRNVPFPLRTAQEGHRGQDCPLPARWTAHMASQMFVQQWFVINTW